MNQITSKYDSLSLILLLFNENLINHFEIIVTHKNKYIFKSIDIFDFLKIDNCDFFLFFYRT